MATVPAEMSTAVPFKSIEERFEELAATWHKAVAHHSSSSIRHGHPAYQEIIALGPPVVPILLRDLEINHRHWFNALAVLTGAHPVPKALSNNYLNQYHNDWHAPCCQLRYEKRHLDCRRAD